MSVIIDSDLARIHYLESILREIQGLALAEPTKTAILHKILELCEQALNEL